MRMLEKTGRLSCSGFFLMPACMKMISKHPFFKIFWHYKQRKERARADPMVLHSGVFASNDEIWCGMTPTRLFSGTLY